MIQGHHNLLVKAPPFERGYHMIARRGEHGLRFLEFGLLKLDAELSAFEGRSGANEAGLDIFAGTCDIEVKTVDGRPFHFESVGARADVFAGHPDMLYIPPQCTYRITRSGDRATVGIFTAPAQNEKAPHLVRHNEAMTLTVGKDNWVRQVATSIGDGVPAEKLIIGETLNPPGNWSSSPPHKHDVRADPNESPMEEIYYFQIDPPQGFALMRVYTAPGDPEPFDNAYVVEDGDTVIIPRGYHPVAAAPGYRVHYTWALAGEERRYGAWSDDPKHAWIRKKQ